MEKDPCEVCRTTAETLRPTGGDFLRQKCPRCGEFRLSGTAASTIRNQRSPEFIANLSGWIHDQNRLTGPPLITDTTLKDITASKGLSISERSERLLLEAVQGQSKIGEPFNINDPRFISATHSQDKEEVQILYKILADQGLIETVAIGGKTEILSKGYHQAESLRIKPDIISQEPPAIVGSNRPNAGTAPVSTAPLDEGSKYSDNNFDQHEKTEGHQSSNSESVDGQSSNDERTEVSNSLKVADEDLGRIGALSDTINHSEDKLQFGARANTFAKLIADKNLRLPLAIGLFGNWGSGKSFFMKLVEGGVKEITDKAAAQNPESSTFLPRIAQIKFNAWHFMDTSLWATMAVRIYEGLMEELAGPKESMAPSARAKLWTDIESSKQRIKVVEAARESARTHMAASLKLLEETKLEREKAEEKFGRKIVEAMKKPGAQYIAICRLEKIAKSFGFQNEIKSVRDINYLISEFQDISGPQTTIWLRFRQKFSTKRSALGFVALMAAALLAIFNLSDMLTWLVNDLLQWPEIFGWVSSRVTAIAAEVFISASAVIAWVSVQLGHLSEGLKKARKLHASIKDIKDTATDETDPLASAKQELRDAEAKVEATEQEIKAAEERLEDANKELQRINAGGLVYDFLAEKLEESEYTKSLGLISTIREDLMNLGQLMEDWREKGPTDVSNAYPIKRIVLYVDDLDRCHPSRVVEVLQAVHLLLAFELFVVVVAVDARWLERSLYLEYAPELFEGTGQTSNVLNIENFSPQNYLEKIFQIPFSVPSMTEESFTELMKHLAGEISVTEETRSNENQSDSPKSALDSEDYPKELVATQPRQNIEQSEFENGASDQNNSDSSKNTEPTILPNPNLSHDFSIPALLPREAECLSCMHILIKTPRSAKRLVNLYRLVRFNHAENISGFNSFLDSNYKPYVATALMLAIGIAYPSVGHPFFNALSIKSSAEKLYSNENMSERKFSEFCSTLHMYLDHLTDEPFYPSEAIKPLVDSVDQELLKKFENDLRITVSSLNEAGFGCEEIPILVFREIQSEVENYSFSWKSV